MSRVNTQIVLFNSYPKSHFCRCKHNGGNEYTTVSHKLQAKEEHTNRQYLHGMMSTHCNHHQLILRNNQRSIEQHFLLKALDSVKLRPHNAIY